jgi:hypothetical protein
MFSDRVLQFLALPASDHNHPTYLCFLHSWDDRCAPSMPSFFFEIGSCYLFCQNLPWTLILAGVVAWDKVLRIIRISSYKVRTLKISATVQISFVPVFPQVFGTIVEEAWSLSLSVDLTNGLLLCACDVSVHWLLAHPGTRVV